MALRFVLAALFLLALPPLAGAATLEVRRETLRYVPERGERNSILLGRYPEGQLRPDGDFVHFWYSDLPRLRLGHGCRQPGHAQNYICKSDGVRRVSVRGGDRSDDMAVAPLGVPFKYSGGRGRDTMAFWLAPRGVAVDNDGVADDGYTRRDNVGRDVEVLGGTEYADRLGSGVRGAELNPGDGDDRVRGGRGDDRVFAATIGAEDLDSDNFFPQGRDRVTCGGGQDLVFADPSDVVARDCEATAYPGPPSGERYRYPDDGFVFKGSAGPDLIVAPGGWSPARISGLAGDDRIEAEFGNTIDGGRGDDRIRADGRNVIHGGEGDDVIAVRAESPFAATRDFVHCGRGHDRVRADRFDRVSRDCERVIR